MFRKLTPLAALALLLIPALTATGADPDPSLMGWWPLDGHALDISGNNRHGTLNGDPGFGPGVYGDAVELDGDDFVSTDGYKGIVGTNPFSVTAWVRSSDVGDHRIVVNWGSAPNGQRIELRAMSGTGILRANHGGGNIQANTPVSDGEWHHVGLTVNADSTASYPEWTLYVDGQDDTIPSTDTDTPLNIVANVDFTIGSRGTHGDRFWVGSIDDVRLYDKVLTPDEVRHIMESGGAEPFPYAARPNPEDGVLLEATWANISWEPGAFAVSHDVYIGESFEDVNNGTADTFVGNQAEPTFIVGFPGYPIPGGLVPGTTYYWRVDEVNDADPNSPWKGPVWSYSIPATKAHNLDPTDGSRFVDPDVTLSWAAGFAAKLHNVYVGDNFDDVNDGAPATLKGAITEMTFVPGTLESGKTYYWRVDEFDGTNTHEGDVVSFETFPFLAIPITDPNLVGWWKLDEGTGSVGAVDSSGYGHHGDVTGDVQWISGYDGDGLEFGGNGYVQMKDYEGILGAHAFSLSIWLRTTTTAIQELIWWGTQSGGQRVEFRIHSNGHIRMGAGNGQVEGATNVTDGQWHHVAVTVVDNATNSSADVRIYVDGQDDTVASADPDAFDLTAGLQFTIGYRPSQGDRPVVGSIDDVHIYDRVLTQAEIEQIMRIDLSLAWNPSPRNGSTPDILSVLPLTWSPGDKTSQHDLYFGLDRDVVAEADTSDTTGVYRGRQGTASYSPGEGVEWAGGPYFWRVDESNTDGTVTKGRVWQLTVADFILVDDFEGYTDNDTENEAIWQHWIDGFEVPTNGSQIGYVLPPYAEQTIVNTGSQSMPFLYDNTSGATNSQAELTMASRHDWTAHDVRVLSLWFQGSVNNAAESMYLALNGNAVVYHDDPAATQIGTWTEWFIDLQEFANQGVDLTNVNTIAIGFGTKDGPAAGGTGQMYFDDIRLYR